MGIVTVCFDCPSSKLTTILKSSKSSLEFVAEGTARAPGVDDIADTPATGQMLSILFVMFVIKLKCCSRRPRIWYRKVQHLQYFHTITVQGLSQKLLNKYM